MNLITPARDCTDSELDARIAYFDMRRQPQQPLDTLDYSCHTAECAPDDEPEAGPWAWAMTPPWPARLALLIVLWIALGAVFL